MAYRVKAYTLREESTESGTRYFISFKDGQGDQPGQALFHTLEHTLVQILLTGQAAEFCVIIAHLVVHQLDHIRRGDDAQQLPAVVQDRERALGVVHDAVDAVADLLVVGDVGVGACDQLFQALDRKSVV